MLASLLCDVLENQRKLTKWYLKKIPIELLSERISVNNQFLNAPIWNIAHLIWTDFNIGLYPLGYTGKHELWLDQVGFGSSGELPKEMPGPKEVIELMDRVHKDKLDYFKSLDDAIMNAPYAMTTMGFRSNYYALLHLARHEGIHAGGLSSFCKFKGIKTI